MNMKKLIIPLILLIVLIGTYLLIDNLQTPYTQETRHDAFSTLRKKLKPDLAVKIILSGKGDKEGAYSDDPANLVDGRVVIQKDGNNWVLPELHNYPGNREEVEKLIINLMKVGAGAPKLIGKSPSTQKDCEVDAQKGKVIQVQNAAGEDLCHITVGKMAAGGSNNCYMRFDNADAIYSATPNLSWEVKLHGKPSEWAENWMDKTMIAFDSDKQEAIKKIAVTRRDGLNFTLEKVEEEKEIPGPKPEDKDNAEGEADKKPETIKETKWYVVTADGTRFEADTSEQSSFTGAFDNMNGAKTAEPGDLARYGLAPAYAAYTIITEDSDKKEKTHVLLVGDQVPDETKTDEPDKDEGKADDDKDASKDDAKDGKKDDDKPKLTNDRYVAIKGDRRIMTLAEWKLKSLDKKAADFKPKPPEPKKDDTKTPENKPPTGTTPPPGKTQGDAVKPKDDAAKPKEAAPVEPTKDGQDSVTPPPAPNKTSTPKEGAAVKELGAKHILISFKQENAPPGLNATLTKEEAKAKIDELLADLKKDPAQFEALAKQWSDCPSKAEGGDLGTFAPDRMVAPFSKAVQAMEVNAISGAVETQFGYHIIKRTQ